MIYHTKFFPAIAFVLLGSALPAQEPANPLSKGQKALYDMVMSPVVAAAQAMPESNYSFKPTPEVRSFGQLIGHIAGSQYMFCASAAGVKPEMHDIEKTKSSKADLVQALQDAQSYCDGIYGNMTDTQASQVVKFFGRDAAKLNILSFNTAHTDEHYGNIVTYLRMKGIVPPTSEARK